MWIWLAASIASANFVAFHLIRAGGQKMWIMNLVWPITALWAGPAGAAAYWAWGRAGNRRARTHAMPSFPVATAKATSHCGAGCTLGDVIATVVAAALPLSIAGHRMFGEWLYGLVAAFALGIAFQYFTIKPMRHLSRRAGLIAAIKADALSLAAWQVGMYGWMALARFAIVGHPFAKTTALFWVLMQVAMFAGFLTSYPVNALLLQHGLKEQM